MCSVHSWALTLSSQPWRWMPAVLRHQPGQVSEMVSCDDKRDPSCCYCSEEMSQKIVLHELSFRLIDSFIYQSGGYPEGYCSRFLKKSHPQMGFNMLNVLYGAMIYGERTLQVRFPFWFAGESELKLLPITKLTELAHIGHLGVLITNGLKSYLLTFKQENGEFHSIICFL